MGNNQETNQLYKCPICGNTDIHSIGYLNGKPYCRRCISFKGEEVKHKPSYPKKAPIHLSYELSSEQKELSDKLVENYKKGIDSLVFAVCGSGKTEISLAVIQYAINCGDKVAFAVPRRDVVIELTNRLKEIFRKNTVISVYGGHHKEVEADLIVLTTHQLYRYKKYFSLIVLDEIDAFPFKNNEVLQNIFFNSLNGHYILMSATPSDEVIKMFQKEGKDILSLNTRFHRHPLPVPIFRTGSLLVRCLHLIKTLKHILNRNRQAFVFVPTIDECETLYNFLRLFFKDGNYVHSQRVGRNSIIQEFRHKTWKFLVTTSVLERGVTIKESDVIVFDSDHKIYDKGTLIQIAGRAGRKADDPHGDVIFIAKKVTKEMEDACASIIKSNKVLQDMLSRD